MSDIEGSGGRADGARACVVIVAAGASEHLDQSLHSLRAHTPAEVEIIVTENGPAPVNEAIARATPADVALLLEPARVTQGWFERLRAAARADTNTASASALADEGTPLAVGGGGDDADARAEQVAEHTLRLRPRLLRAVGPCIYIRRDALELVGALDERLPLREGVELDLAQRCLQSGLAHVLADDVLVGRLEHANGGVEVSAELTERYPYLADRPLASAPALLGLALEAARQPRDRLSVTVDARALDGAVTGTHVHIIELIRALAHTGALNLRLLVRRARIDAPTLALLEGLPQTELLSEEQIDEHTPATTILHRPQQTFAAEDVQLAQRLGERIVVSQLDLIAYSNPGYFADAHAWTAFRRASRQGMSMAERVVVFSQHTRRELVSEALVEDSRIAVVPPGLDHGSHGEPQPPAQLAAHARAAQHNAQSSPYLLCLGTDFRHKNRVFALRLLAELRGGLGWEGRLVLAGTHIPHGSSRPLEEALLAERPGLRESVLELGSVSEPERLWLMRHAAAVVYPSVYEGFGLVPLEAGLCGVPCIFAAHSALGETLPPGLATIVPWDPARSARAAMALLGDEASRAAHVDALADAAGELRWSDAARAIVEVYRQAALAPVREAATLGRDALARERELTDAHAAVVERLIEERELVLSDYERLRADVGWGLSLIGPNGSLPEHVQRALLALSAHPAVSRPLYGALSLGFRGARALAHPIRLARRRGQGE